MMIFVSSECSSDSVFTAYQLLGLLAGPRSPNKISNILDGIRRRFRNMSDNSVLIGEVTAQIPEK
jgi:hypothetical protein